MTESKSQGQNELITLLSNETFTLMVAISKQSSTVPEIGKDSICRLTEEDVKTEFDDTDATRLHQDRTDKGSFRKYGILPARLFEGKTRIVWLKNRGIAWLGIELGGKNTSATYSTDQESDEHTVLCL